MFSYGAPIFSQLICCSKTQIALAYVYWLREMHPDVSVFWVHASNPERFHQAYTSIAEECSIPGYDDPEVDVLSLVQTFLERKFQNRWMMVIDNADDTQLFFRTTQEGNDANPSDSMIKSEGSLGRYIPECAHGSILMTTRNKQAGSRFARGKSTIKVGEMTDTEAHQMVCAILEDDSISLEEASLLSSRLECLPLALAQAVAFIVENSISISEYVRLLDESDSSLVDRLSEPFEAIGRDSNTPHALTATWIISFEQIERRHLFASEVLSLVSLFDRQQFRETLLLNTITECCRKTQRATRQSSQRPLALSRHFLLSQRERTKVSTCTAWCNWLRESGWLIRRGSPSSRGMRRKRCRLNTHMESLRLGNYALHTFPTLFPY